jgi:agmatine/peptidylarginine deiminase
LAIEFGKLSKSSKSEQITNDCKLKNYKKNIKIVNLIVEVFKMQNWVLFFVVLFHTHLIIAQISNQRHPAEWEELQAVVMEFLPMHSHPDVPWDEAVDPYVKTAQACIGEGINFIVFDPPSEGSNPEVDIDTVLSNRGIISPLIEIIEVDGGVNFPWTRDNGMFCIYENEIGNIYMYDFPNDSTSDLVADLLGYPHQELPMTYPSALYYDGGNFLTDGHGTFNIASKWVSEEVPYGLVNNSIPEFPYYGISQTLNVGGSEAHIDYFLKLVNEETAIVSYIPQSNYDDEVDPPDQRFHQDSIDVAVNMLNQKLHSAFGRDFTFIPVQNAPSSNSIPLNTTVMTAYASYTNALILNKTVLVPQYVSEPYDQIALDAYQQAMPGYNVVGVNCRQYQQGAGGGVHCITHEIYAENPIYIKHKWLPDTLNQTTDYTIDAYINSNGGISSAKVYWRDGITGSFTPIDLTNISGNQFTANIPGQPYGTTLCYYIKVENNNGKTISKPMVAPNGYFKCLIDDGVSAADESNINNVAITYKMHQNYPNPFNPITTIKYSIPKEDQVGLEILNVLGEKVELLVNETKPAGLYEATWDASNMSSGIYFYRLQAGDFIETKKMVLMK